MAETTQSNAGRPEGDNSIQLELGWEYLTKYTDLKEVIPTVAGYAQYCRSSGYPVSRDTIYSRKEFSDIIAQIKEIQERDLANGGLSGDYHPRFAQFLLTAKHGYIEKQAVAVSNLKETLDELEDEDDAREELAKDAEQHLKGLDGRPEAAE